MMWIFNGICFHLNYIRIHSKMTVGPLRLMKFILVITAVLICYGCAESETDAPSEIRGVWLTNIDSDIMFSRENTEYAMEFLAERGFNVVFPVVWNAGYTLYPSDVMVDYFGEDYRLHPDFADEDRDPLQDIITEAHRHGIEVMPWFEYGFAASHDADGGHIIEAYPDWAAKDSLGNLLTKNDFEWMNAIKPEVQDFMMELIGEVMENYDIDGIQGDDRLPAMPTEGGYSDFTASLYEEETGEEVPLDPREEEFLQWKADKLSDFGGHLYEKVKAHDEDYIVSLSPSVYPWSKNHYLQDWPEWIRRGQVEMVHPQVYRFEIDQYIETLEETMDYYTEALEDLQTSETGKRVLMAPGVLIKVGDRYNGPDYVSRALEFHREIGTHGEVYFFYEGLHESNKHLGDSLYHHHYYEPAKLPYRQSPRRTGETE